MKLYSVALMAMLASCNTMNGAYMTDKGIMLPNMPQSVEVNGQVIELPKGPWDKKTTNEVLIKLRKSEMVNASAVRDAKRFYKKLQADYAKGAK